MHGFLYVNDIYWCDLCGIKSSSPLYIYWVKLQSSSTDLEMTEKKCSSWNLCKVLTEWLVQTCMESNVCPLEWSMNLAIEWLIQYSKIPAKFKVEFDSTIWMKQSECTGYLLPVWKVSKSIWAIKTLKIWINQKHVLISWFNHCTCILCCIWIWVIHGDKSYSATE